MPRQGIVYLLEARDDASNMVLEFLDETVDSFIDNDGEASNDFNNDYSDSWHHETSIDKWYSLSDAAQVLE